LIGRRARLAQRSIMDFVHDISCIAQQLMPDQQTDRKCGWRRSQRNQQRPKRRKDQSNHNRKTAACTATDAWRPRRP